MDSKAPCFRVVSSILYIVLGLLLTWSGLYGQTHLDLNGNFNFLLSFRHPDAFVLTPDQRIGVVLTAATSPQIGGVLTTFDVGTTTSLDSKFTGFGPLQVQLAALSDGVRVVAVTSRGGPNTVTIFDMDTSGILTFRAETQLTSSGSDERSNLVLSPRGRSGFIRVRSSQNVSELVSFSLDTGSILQHIALPVSDVLAVRDFSDHSLLVSGAGQNLYFIDVTDPSNISLAGQTVLPPTGFGSFPNDMAFEFSDDGTIVFGGGVAARLSAVNTSSFKLLGSFGEPYQTYLIAVKETLGQRRLALYGGNDDFLGLSLIEATDPTDLHLISQRDLHQAFFGNRDIAFGRDPDNIILASDPIITGVSVATYRLPQFVPLLSTKLLPYTSLAFTIKALGTPEHIIGAWQSDDNRLGRIYNIPNKTNTFASFDLDGKTDVGTFGGVKTGWKWLRSLDGKTVGPITFGEAGDIPLPEDYDGDRQTDLAIFRPSAGIWQIKESGTGTTRTLTFGKASDIPVPADYDGDGKVDVAVFSSSPNRWLIIKSSDGQLLVVKAGFGKLRPVTGDFDGDGKADFAAFGHGLWNIRLSSGGGRTISFGNTGDIPVSGDFDNDGVSDIGLYSPAMGRWLIQESFGGFQEIEFGDATDIPVPADYDGDGRTDIAVYKSVDSTWRIIRSTGTGLTTVQFGSPGDRPLTLRY